MVNELVEILAFAGFAAAAVQVALMVGSWGGVKLPHPGKIGLPTGGLASPAAAHAALTGRPVKRQRRK